MIDVTALRAGLAERAGLALPDFTAYDHLPGVARLPAVVVGLPDRITWEQPASLAMPLVDLPVIVALGNPYAPATEAALSVAALQLAAALRGSTGPAWRSCRVVSIDEFAYVTIAKAPALSVNVNLSLLTLEV